MKNKIVHIFYSDVYLNNINKITDWFTNINGQKLYKTHCNQLVKERYEK